MFTNDVITRDVMFTQMTSSVIHSHKARREVCAVPTWSDVLPARRPRSVCCSDTGREISDMDRTSESDTHRTQNSDTGRTRNSVWGTQTEQETVVRQATKADLWQTRPTSDLSGQTDTALISGEYTDHWIFGRIGGIQAQGFTQLNYASAARIELYQTDLYIVRLVSCWAVPLPSAAPLQLPGGPTRLRPLSARPVRREQTKRQCVRGRPDLHMAYTVHRHNLKMGVSCLEKTNKVSEHEQGG